MRHLPYKGRQKQDFFTAPLLAKPKKSPLYKFYPLLPHGAGRRVSPPLEKGGRGIKNPSPTLRTPSPSRGEGGLSIHLVGINPLLPPFSREKKGG